MKDVRTNIIKKARRVVVKVGSAVIALEGRSSVFERLSGDVQALKRAGLEIVIVSSGAVAMGMKKLGRRGRPSTIPERQAIAAVGQAELMARYDEAFSRHKGHAGQVLLTHDDFADRKRFLNARNTVTTLLKLGITPVINENDTVAVDEIKFGDNDALSALATNLVEADLLVILTDIDGLYESDPKKDKDAPMVSVVQDVDDIRFDLGDAVSNVGTGGMRSKCEAAKKAAHFGVATVVTSGYVDDVLKRILIDREGLGTLFLPKEDKLTSWKHWIAFSTRPSGRVVLDDGAINALLNKGKSLLPSGITDVDGSFDAGEVVHCVDAKGKELARGITNYSSEEIKRIKGVKTRDIESILGYKVFDEVIHRDNCVVL